MFPRIARLGATIITALALLACSGTLRPSSDELPALEGYTLLRVPRSELPVGARWRPGIGPDGAGLDQTRLLTIPAPAGFETSAQFQTGLASRLAATLGLSADAQRDAKLEAKNLTVVRIRNLSDEDLEPGNQILYEAVKAGDFTFTYSSGLSAQAQATATVRAQSLGLSISSTSSEKTVLTGRDLYVAFRVISISPPEVKTQKTRSRSAERIQIGDYELTLDPREVYGCMCGGRPLGSRIEYERVHACYSRVPASATAVNNQLGGVGTGGKDIRFKYHLRQVGSPNWITLNTRNRGDAVEVDKISFYATLSLGAGRICLLLHREELDESQSVFELRTITYRFSPVPSPGGPL